MDFSHLILKAVWCSPNNLNSHHGDTHHPTQQTPLTFGRMLTPAFAGWIVSSVSKAAGRGG